MKIRIKILTIIILYFYSNNVLSQKVEIINNSLITSYFNELYIFSFNKSNEILNILEKRNIPKHIYYNLKANSLWWEILNGNNSKTVVDNCYNYIDKSVDYYKKIEKPDINNKLILFNNYILSMRLNNYNNKKIKSASELIKFLKLGNSIKDSIKDKEQKMFINGVYYYFLNFSKENSIIASIALYNYKGKSRIFGLKALEISSNADNPIVKTESNYLLYKIYSELENNKKLALIKIKKLNDLYPENIFYKTEYYKMLIENNKIKKADELKKALLLQLNNSKELKQNQKEHYRSIILNFQPKKKSQNEK